MTFQLLIIGVFLFLILFAIIELNTTLIRIATALFQIASELRVHN